MRQWMKTCVICGLSALSLLVMSGCATLGDLRRIESKMLRIRTDLQATQTTQSRQTEDMNRLQSELRKLTRILSSFRKKGQYNFANLGVKVDELRTMHHQLLGQLKLMKMEIEKDHEKSEKLLKAYSLRFGDPTESSSSNQVMIQAMSPKASFQSAKALFDNGKYNEARSSLQVFVKRYPRDELTDDAFILLGDCYYRLKNYFEAILWYNDARKKFPRGNQVALALLKLGKAHYKIKACVEGQAFFRSLLRKFKSSPHAKSAQEHWRDVRQLCK